MIGNALDLFSKAGGASSGYWLAGYRVVGIDIEDQPNYPYPFLRMDALDALTELLLGRGLRFSDGSFYFLSDFALIHASPPCQLYSLIAAGGKRRADDHPDLVGPVRDLLRTTRVPYVIENVPQAPLENPIHLCGTRFDLPIIRHRDFECSFPAESRMCTYKPTARVRHPGYTAYPYGRKKWGPAWREHVVPVLWPWMTLREAGEAIPGAYTHYVARQLINHLKTTSNRIVA